ncbi:hypothetical protein [Streptomyces sp. NPDC051016]|uniref:hypothetical protein n=1 Tax=Streptomyces sp. NPDC051016 TaxID=3365638 RepID=UPI0037B2DF92
MTEGATLDIADEHIVGNRILRGIMAIRAHLGCSLHEGLDVFVARYTVLREERPGDFTCGHAEYWEGFYS